LQFRSALSRISKVVYKYRLSVTIISVPVSILLNLIALYWLTQMYSSLPPVYTQLFDLPTILWTVS
jgi:hypothetical protein